MSDTSVTLNDLLQTLSIEIAALSRTARDLQPFLSRAVETSVACPVSIRAVQSSDLLTQKLEDIASFIDQIAPELPSDWTLDISVQIARLRLSALAATLSCSRPVVSEQSVSDEFFF